MGTQHIAGTADDSSNVAEYNYTVDKLGRTTRTDELIGGMGTVFKVFQDFDAVGNRTVLSVDVPDEWSDITLYKNTYTFDGLDRLDNVQQFDVAGGHVVADKRVNYVYNALSQVTYINRFHNLTGGNGAALRTRPLRTRPKGATHRLPLFRTQVAGP